MSSFASGNLLRKEYLEVVKSEMGSGSLIIDLGDWIAYLTRWDGCGIEGWRESDINAEIHRMSEKAPVLLWNHPEDHGWCFAILENRRIVSQFLLGYEYFFHFSENEGIFQMTPVSAEETSILINTAMKDLDVDKIDLFGLNAEQLTALRALFTEDNLRDECTRLGMVDGFKEILNFEMDFLSYEKVLDFKEYYTILARKEL